MGASGKGLADAVEGEGVGGSFAPKDREDLTSVSAMVPAPSGDLVRVALSATTPGVTRLLLFALPFWLRLAFLLIPGLSTVGDLRQQGPDTLDVFFTPQANPDVADTLHGRNGYLLSLDIPIHAHQTEFEFLSCLCGGISLSHSDS